MHPIAEKLLMLRDKDFIRWGRLSTAAMVVVALICFGGALVCDSVIRSELLPLVQKEDKIDANFVERIEDDKVRAYVSMGFQSRSRVIEHLAGMTRWAAAGALVAAGLLALVAAALSWRSYELAVAKCGLEGANEGGPDSEGEGTE